jgi:cytochrome c biogenesis protein CcmG, thiol:disulfide interchange protein DsbE
METEDEPTTSEPTATSRLPSADDRRRTLTRRVLVAAAILFPAGLLIALTLVLRAYEPKGLTGPREFQAADFAATPIADGRPAPSFSLPLLGGTGTSGPDAGRGHVLVVNLWASWCGPCRAEAPGIERVWEAYRGRGVRFLGVDHEDGSGAALAFVRRFGLTYPMVADPSGSVSAKYGALGIPSTYVITPDGTIAYRFLGRVDPIDLERILDRLLTARR